MKVIPLTRGYEAIVDDADYEWLMQFKWSVLTGRNDKNYVRTNRKIDGKDVCVLMHRLIMPVLPHFQIDHINGDGLDNRRENLRVATPSLNQINAGSRNNRSSQYKGVRRKGNKWIAVLGVGGKQRHFGTFDTELEAARAVDEAQRRIYGRSAKLNLAA